MSDNEPYHRYMRWMEAMPHTPTCVFVKNKANGMPAFDCNCGALREALKARGILSLPASREEGS